MTVPYVLHGVHPTNAIMRKLKQKAPADKRLAHRCRPGPARAEAGGADARESDSRGVWHPRIRWSGAWINPPLLPSSSSSPLHSSPSPLLHHHPKPPHPTPLPPPHATHREVNNPAWGSGKQSSIGIEGYHLLQFSDISGSHQQFNVFLTPLRLTLREVSINRGVTSVDLPRRHEHFINHRFLGASVATGQISSE